MNYTTLISTDTLTPHLGEADWAVIDARFSLADTEQGRRAYEAAHIPGAIYAHLDEDLSGPIIRGHTSRHPLPDVATLVETFSTWGIDAGVQVVVYDDANGSIASRLWWMLRWLGHEAVAVLDGGIARWQAEGRPVKRGTETRAARTFTPEIHSEMVASADEVNAVRQQAEYRVVDSRAANRYRGEDETLDPVAGHIPGAVCSPFGANVGPDGRFLPADEIRVRLEDVLAGRDPSQTIFYCGSGVTAAHNVLAMEYAGLSGSRLYAGSWSEWITDPDRPVATGPNP